MPSNRPPPPTAYRGEAPESVRRLDELERENASLRKSVIALIVVTVLLGTAAAWWFGLLWKLTR